MGKQEFFEKVRKKFEKDGKVLAVLAFGPGAKKPYKYIDLCLVLDKEYSRKIYVRKKSEYSTSSYGKTNKLNVYVFQELSLENQKQVLEKGKVLFSKN